MKDIFACLAQSPIFSRLTEEERRKLVSLARMRVFHKGDIICLQDTFCPMAGYIMTGQAEWAMLSEDGKRQVVFKLHPCDTIWAHSIIDGQVMPASLEVTQTSLIYLWPSEIILPFISNNTEALWDISRILLNYMRHVREAIYGFAFYPVAGRLARLLLRYYQPEPGQSVRRSLTLDEMADMVGTTRELISKTLHRFAREGILEISRTQLIFKDLPTLQRLAGKHL